MRTIQKKTIVIAGIIGLGILVTTTITNKVITNPPVTADIQVPLPIKQILERSCYDCHSNKTNIHWYDKLPIVSGMVADDVTAARKHFNFSEWDKLGATDQQAALWLLYNMMRAGRMPLASYTAIHPEAKISASDLAVFENYLNTKKIIPTPDEYKEMQADSLLRQQQEREAKAKLPISPNGIQHMPDYRNWQVMSTTSRFDNTTMRVMYANPIAYAAIKSNHINPWPNGAVIVKVVWEKLPDNEGNIRPGKLVNIQYMVRDTEKYKDTEGWGFAKFDTPALQPYGTIASTANCISCHKAAAQTGYVFDLSTETPHP